MNKPPAFQLYVDDFLADEKTAVMTTQQFGAYCLLLFYAWKQDPPGTLPKDDKILAKLARMAQLSWAKNRAQILCAFSAQGNRYVSKRLAHEYKKLMEYHERMSAQGQSGARKRWGNSQAIAKPKPSNSIPIPIPIPIINNKTIAQKPSASEKKNHYAEEFEKFWEVYPRRVDKKRALSQFAARRREGAQVGDILAAAKNMALVSRNKELKYIPYPSKFLGKLGNWEEYIEGVPEKKKSIKEWAKDEMGRSD